MPDARMSPTVGTPEGVGQELEIVTMQDGWRFLMNQGAVLALMPIEGWLEGLRRAEAIGPFVDPTLYREYLDSGKGELIQDVLRGALVFKRAILDAQKKIQSNPWLRE